MAWVAVDRAVRTLEELPELDGPVDHGGRCATRSTPRCARRASTQDASAFTQYYGSDELDASVLMIPLVGFLPAHDPRVIGTVEAIERELLDDGFVLRYTTSDDGSVDGLTGREGAFLACSFWMVDYLHLIGRDDEAVELFERLLGLRNDARPARRGVRPDRRARMVGNFPQAFSHVSLINSAFRLSGNDPLATVPDADGRVLINSFNPNLPVFGRIKRLGHGKVTVKKREGSSR